MPSDNIKTQMRLTQIGNCEIDNHLSSFKADQIEIGKLKIDYSAQVEINRPLSQVAVRITLCYYMGTADLFVGKLTCFFEVEGLSSFIEVDENKEELNIKSDFLPSLIGISFSTSRGYFVRELVGTPLEAYPFPIVSNKSLLSRVKYQVI